MCISNICAAEHIKSAIDTGFLSDLPLPILSILQRMLTSGEPSSEYGKPGPPDAFALFWSIQCSPSGVSWRMNLGEIVAWPLT
jgi:hypothetical protein